MTLHEVLEKVPTNTLLRSHLDGKTATASEILAKQRDESGYELHRSRSNYGRDEYYVIVATGAGIMYSEVQHVEESI